jgi:hypothetical protein
MVKSFKQIVLSLTGRKQSIFSMSMFNWDAKNGEPIVSSYIWVFVVLALGLTVITVVLWRIWTQKDVKNTKETQTRIDSFEPGDDMV